MHKTQRQEKEKKLHQKSNIDLNIKNQTKSLSNTLLFLYFIKQKQEGGTFPPFLSSSCFFPVLLLHKSHFNFVIFIFKLIYLFWPTIKSPTLSSLLPLYTYLFEIFWSFLHDHLQFFDIKKRKKKMGICFSTTKNNNATPVVIPSADVNHNNDNATTPVVNNDQQKKQQKRKRKKSGRTVPIGKKTNFGYERDFEKRYTVGKLLGHGQFGYTYSATDNSTGNLVAVKKIDKNKVPFHYKLIYVAHAQLTTFLLVWYWLMFCACFYDPSV